jgi:hypothetical protein
MKKFQVACSPPSCSCPTLTVEEDVDGNPLIVIADDYEGVVVMTGEEFLKLIKGFLDAISED